MKKILRFIEKDFGFDEKDCTLWLKYATTQNQTRRLIMTILSIDAWASSEPKTWDWNAWYAVGKAPNGLAGKSTRVILAWMRKEGYLNASSAGRVAIEDDGYNLVIVDRVTREPLYALELY